MTPTARASWPTVPDGVLGAARQVALDALALAPLERYYDVEGGYAGATFLSASGNLPADVTSGDLYAASLVDGIAVPAPAARRLLDDGPHRERVLAALRAVPTDVPLAQAGSADLQLAWALVDAVREALRPPRARRSDPWAAAATLSARKRPRLLAATTPEVRRVLGLHRLRDGRVDLQVLQALLADPAVAAAVPAAAERARTAGVAAGRTVVVDTEPLRLLQVALWWAGQPGSAAEAAEAARAVGAAGPAAPGGRAGRTPRDG